MACSANAARSSSSVDVTVDEHRFVGPIEAKTMSPPLLRAGDLDAGAVDLGGHVRAVAQREPVGPEGVREDDPAAGLDVGAGDRLHLVGVGEVPQIRALAAVQAAREQLGAPGAVGEHRAADEELVDHGRAAPTSSSATRTAAFALSA